MELGLAEPTALSHCLRPRWQVSRWLSLEKKRVGHSLGPQGSDMKGEMPRGRGRNWRKGTGFLLMVRALR